MHMQGGKDGRKVGFSQGRVEVRKKKEYVRKKGKKSGRKNIPGTKDKRQKSRKNQEQLQDFFFSRG